ncbi:MAG: peptide-methionine (S)-S-oxide reductase MsrA [Christensenellales bacterium]|jgi:peptide methionine sulfoxide reductase msrA/msrB
MYGKLPPNPNAGTAFNEEDLRTIYLAGGCFWGTQAFMARVPGVASTEVGYANGKIKNPTYKDVCGGDTGFVEAVQVKYDPAVAPLEKVLEAFFLTIDPTVKNRQGNDVGTQYRTGIYYEDERDLPVVEELVRSEQMRYSRIIVTEVLPLENFYLAEEYHQEYLEKNPGGYCHVDFSKLPQV